MVQQQNDPHARKHWDGPHWGAHGAVKEGLFKLLSTLIAARKTAPTGWHKIGDLIGIVTLYAILRIRNDLDDHTADELDILATASRGLKQYGFAIKCGEHAVWGEGALSPSYPLLLAGLMRDHEALRSLKSGGQESGRYFNQLKSVYGIFEFDPPEQKVRVLRALAWFTNMYGSPEETITFVGTALTLARELGATVQFEEIKREFPDYVF